MEEEEGQDGAQEEGGEGEGDVYREEFFSFRREEFYNFKSEGEPDQPANVTNCTDSHVDPSEDLTEPDT